MAEYKGPTKTAAALFIVTVLLVIAGTGFAVWKAAEYSQQNKAAIAALCSEEYDVAIAPVAPASTKLGVQIVVDFRRAYVGLGCVPKLPPPSAELVAKAKEFGIHLHG